MYLSSDDNRLSVMSTRDLSKDIDYLSGRGSKEINKSLKHLTSYSSEEGIFLWCLGNNDVGVLKLDTLEYEVVENFTESETTGDLPLSLQSRRQGQQLLGLTLDRQTRAYHLIYCFLTGPASRPVKRPIQTVDATRTRLLQQ